MYFEHFEHRLGGQTSRLNLYEMCLGVGLGGEMPVRRSRFGELQVVAGGGSEIAESVAAGGDRVQIAVQRPTLTVVEGGLGQANLEHLSLIDKDRETLAIEHQSPARRLRTRMMMATTSCWSVGAAIFMR